MNPDQKTHITDEMRNERVAFLAYEIWLQESQPHGKANEHWHQACMIVDGEIAALEGNELPVWLNRIENTESSKAEHDGSAEIVAHPSKSRRSAA